MIRRPVQERTAMLLTLAAQQFQAAQTAILAACVKDGEVPDGTQLDITNGPPVWLVPETPKHD